MVCAHELFSPDIPGLGRFPSPPGKRMYRESRDLFRHPRVNGRSYDKIDPREHRCQLSISIVERNMAPKKLTKGHTFLIGCPCCLLLHVDEAVRVVSERVR